MKNSKVLKTYLIYSGVLLIFFGGATLLMPLELKASFGVIIPQDINVLNDIRAYSALGLAIGILAILGAFKRKLTYTASLVVFIQFLALGFGRSLSMLLDGIQVEGIPGVANEFFLGIIGAILFIKYQEKHSGEN